jgi:hypothetical protein
MARLGESNTPGHLAGEGNGGRQLAALLGRQGTYTAPASQSPSLAKTITTPQDHRTPRPSTQTQRLPLSRTPAPFEDSRTNDDGARFWPPG